MKIVVAPDSFKECLFATEVAEAISEGLLKVIPDAEIIKLPIADGGEGTTEALVTATNGSYFFANVRGPLGHEHKARWGILGNQQTAVIEVAAACGLDSVAIEQRNPLLSTSYGVGELIIEALNHGTKKIILGLGGSATNDGGVGLMQALGVKFLDISGKDVAPGGGNLQSIENIDTKFLDPRLADIKFEVACDVTNTLTGKEGTSAVFGPQKGADSEMVKKLDQNLTHLGNMIKQTIHEDISDIKGSGAAGGIGGAMVAFLNSELKSGIEIVLDLLNIDRHLSNADLVITGEGRFDKQSLKGKAPIGIVKRAAQYDCDVYILAGSVEKSVLEPKSLGIKKIINISPINVTHDIALKFAYKNLVDASSKLAKIAITN